MPHESVIQPRLVDVHGVARLYGISPRTVWRLCKLQKIPQPVRFGQRATRWRLADLEAHIGQLKLADPSKEDTKSLPGEAETAERQPGRQPIRSGDTQIEITQPVAETTVAASGRQP